MNDLLVKDALSSTWGNPDPYNQVILKPARLSTINGVNKRIQYGWGILEMPNSTSTFHVYQTGQISPILINLVEANATWQLFSEACTSTKVMADLYTILGVQLPRIRCWFRWVEKKNIVFAVEINDRIDVPWAQLEIYLRLYKNSFFETNGLGNNYVLQIGGRKITTQADLAAVQGETATLMLREEYMGGMTYFVNGLKVESLSVLNVAIGDVVEYVFDTSIYKIVSFTLDELPSFTSTLDHKPKGLLHYNAPNEQLIDYEDHIDLYLYDVTTGRGVYMHKNAADTLRQLTHKDYALARDYLPAYYEHFRNDAGYVNTANLRLKLYIRYSGQGYSPKRDANMSRYISLLNGSQQMQAMVGINASLPLWQAAQLESSAYMRLMRADYSSITPELVEDAYGYARVNKLLGDAIQAVTVVDDNRVVVIPPTYQISATAFEYDSAGVLLGVYPCAANSLSYYPTQSTCTTVEFVEGQSAVRLDEFNGSDPMALSEGNSYRFYLKVASAPLEPPVWQDVTGTGHYSIDSGVAYWGDNTIMTSLERVIRSDKKFLFYETTLNLDSGILVHQISYEKLTSQGYVSTALSVPMGELDVWLNGHPLVRGVDYLLNFPTLSIINKSYLTFQTAPVGALQTLSIRMTGFCTTDMQLRPIAEVGYVRNGVLSTNDRFDLHAEKVLRVVVGGSLKRLDEVAFVEAGTAAQVLAGPLEGQPYEIRDVINRLNGLVTKDAYALYDLDRSRELDAVDYLSTRVAQVNAYPISPIPNRYALFSPFLSKILMDLDAGYINLSSYVEPFSDATVRTLCAPYQYLLALDPIGPGNLPDPFHCVIHPHPLNNYWSLPVLKYSFFERVVRIFAGEKVNYSSMVNII